MSVVLPTLDSPVKIIFILTSVSPSMSKKIYLNNQFWWFDGYFNKFAHCCHFIVDKWSRPAVTYLLDWSVYWIYSNMRIRLIIFICSLHHLLNVISHSIVLFRWCFEVNHSFFAYVFLNFFKSDYMLEICLATHQKQRTFNLIELQGFNKNWYSFEGVSIVEAKAYTNCVRIFIEAKLLRKREFLRNLDLSPPTVSQSNTCTFVPPIW